LSPMNCARNSAGPWRVRMAIGLDAIDCIILACSDRNTRCAPHRGPAGRDMATIYDIAKHVGVSAGTVSRALSRPEKVLPATRERIERAAAALGYVPNAVARTLKTQRSGRILITVPDIANPFFAQILQGAEDAAQAAGYAVLLGDTQHQPEREERYAQMLPRNEADGMIVLGHRLPPT